jgi:hypothetical protein
MWNIAAYLIFILSTKAKNEYFGFGTQIINTLERDGRLFRCSALFGLYSALFVQDGCLLRCCTM